MHITGPWMFVIGTLVTGLGIGFYFERKLEGSNQNIQLPSAFGYKGNKTDPSQGVTA
jgi:hypothetical protein